MVRIDDALNALPDARLIEIDEQAQAAVGDLQVGEDLGLEDRSPYPARRHSPSWLNLPFWLIGYLAAWRLSGSRMAQIIGLK